MAKGDWWLKLEIHTWQNDICARKLKRENRDSWLTACMLMHLEGTDRLEGAPSELSNALHLTHSEFWDFVNDLQSTKAADVTACPEFVTIVSRRYRKELKVKEDNRIRKQRQREAEDVTPESRDRVKSKSNKKEIREEKEEEPPAAATPDPAQALVKVEKPKPAKAEKMILPLDWRPSPTLLAWTRDHYPALDINETLEDFLDFWRDIATRDNKRTLRGWDATWKKRIKTLKEKGGTNGTRIQNFREQRSAEKISERQQLDAIRASLNGPNGYLPETNALDRGGQFRAFLAEPDDGGETFPC